MEHLNLFYRGAYTNTVYTCRYDGHKWTGNTSIVSQPGNIAVVSPFNPSSVVFNNRIYLFYRANEGPELCCAWYDGTRWYGGQPIHTMNGGINPKSNHSPNVTVYRSTIFLTYLDPQGYDVYTAWFDGTKWGGDTKISSQNGGITPRSSVNPAICTYKDQLYIVYPGEWTGNLYSAWFNGAYWDGNTEIADQPGDISPASSYTPGIGVYENRLIIVYLGAHLNNLYSASFNGTRWSGNTKISDQPGGISPSRNSIRRSNRLVTSFISPIVAIGSARYTPQPLTARSGQATPPSAANQAALIQAPPTRREYACQPQHRGFNPTGWKTFQMRPRLVRSIFPARMIQRQSTPTIRRLMPVKIIRFPNSSNLESACLMCGLR